MVVRGRWPQLDLVCEWIRARNIGPVYAAAAGSAGRRPL